jgi:hypothetical protein
MYICTCMHMNNMKKKHQLHQPLLKCRLKTLALPENGNRSQGTRTHTPCTPQRIPAGNPPVSAPCEEYPPSEHSHPLDLVRKTDEWVSPTTG